MSYRKILIAGIPGTGKTCVGNALAEKRDFKHLNLESEDLCKQLYQNPNVFVEAARDAKADTVITWGFHPEYQTPMVLAFKENGFKIIWFDGDRESARRAFNKRGDVREELFDLQLKRIDEFDVIKKIDPTNYNTFLAGGDFKNMDTIVSDILVL